MAIIGLLVQTGLPRGLSHFWFCLPVPGDGNRSQLWSLYALEVLLASGRRDVCSLSETL